MASDNEPTDFLLKPGEVARLLRVTTVTLTNWSRAGKLTPVLTPGSHRRYRASDTLSQPGVSFDYLGYNGSVTEIDEITMVQNGVSVSTPSDLDSNGLSDGFTVSYTGNEGSNLVRSLHIGHVASAALRTVQVGLGAPARREGAPFVDRPINAVREQGESPWV